MSWFLPYLIYNTNSEMAFSEMFCLFLLDLCGTLLGITAETVGYIILSSIIICYSKHIQSYLRGAPVFFLQA